VRFDLQWSLVVSSQPNIPIVSIIMKVALALRAPSLSKSISFILDPTARAHLTTNHRAQYAYICTSSTFTLASDANSTLLNIANCYISKPL
jgi:hypothetical protein